MHEQKLSSEEFNCLFPNKARRDLVRKFINDAASVLGVTRIVSVQQEMDGVPVQGIFVVTVGDGEGKLVDDDTKFLQDIFDHISGDRAGEELLGCIPIMTEKGFWEYRNSFENRQSAVVELWHNKHMLGPHSGDLNSHLN